MTTQTLEQKAKENDGNAMADDNDMLIKKCHRCSCGKELRIPKYINDICKEMRFKSSDEKHKCSELGKQHDGFYLSYDTIPYCTKDCFDFSTED